MLTISFPKSKPEPPAPAEAAPKPKATPMFGRDPFFAMTQIKPVQAAEATPPVIAVPEPPAPEPTSPADDAIRFIPVELSVTASPTVPASERPEQQPAAAPFISLPVQEAPGLIRQMDTELMQHQSLTMAATPAQPKANEMVLGENLRVVAKDVQSCQRFDLDGYFEGKIVTEHLIVREHGAFKGTVNADTIEVHGRLEGNGVVTKLLDVRASGVAVGVFVYSQLSIAPGGIVNGEITHQAGTASMPERMAPYCASSKASDPDIWSKAFRKSGA